MREQLAGMKEDLADTRKDLAGIHLSLSLTFLKNFYRSCGKWLLCNEFSRRGHANESFNRDIF